LEAAVLDAAAVGAEPALEGGELPDSQPQTRTASPNKVRINPALAALGARTVKCPLVVPPLGGMPPKGGTTSVSSPSGFALRT